MPALRYRSCEPVSAAEALNLRRSSATTGRITDGFCLSDRTAPSNTSNSIQAIHISRAEVARERARAAGRARAVGRTRVAEPERARVPAVGLGPGLVAEASEPGREAEPG